MLDIIMHRGPDDSGVYTHKTFSLGMRRLSIIDINKGQQPQFSPDGRYAIVYNGEIYNYQDIQRALKEQGAVFQSNSDTEVVLHLYERLGIDCLQYLRGMFALAILDTVEGILFVARDRMGIKPLYYYYNNGLFVAASEIKALLRHPAVPRSLNHASLDSYLTLRYVPGPDCLLHGVKKFPAANYMYYKNGNIQFKRYWTPPVAESSEMSDGEALDRFGELFNEATRIRMISERPVGLFLSGGLDSTAIAASVRRNFDKPMKTFSVGFGWKGDELSAAAATARKLGFEHHEVLCRPQDTALLPEIAWHLDEPLGDAIVLPMYLLARAASQEVTVVQSGEGADEMLGGYFMHKVVRWADLYSRFVPGLLHKGGVMALAGAMPAKFLNLLFDYPGDLGESGKLRLLELLSSFKNAGPKEHYTKVIALFTRADKLRLLRPDTLKLLEDESLPVEKARLKRLSLSELLALQFDHWLPDDILCKLDKLTMAHSLEGRVPFMDHVLVEFLLSLPPRQKLTLFSNKVILRRWLKANAHPEMASKKKIPFYIPLEQYLSQEPLKSLIGDYLSEERIGRAGIFNPNEVARLRRLSAGHGVLASKQLFSLLMFEMWREKFLGA